MRSLVTLAVVVHGLVSAPSRPTAARPT
jgi:hypothetical protein